MIRWIKRIGRRIEERKYQLHEDSLPDRKGEYVLTYLAERVRVQGGSSDEREETDTAFIILTANQKGKRPVSITLKMESPEEVNLIIEALAQVSEQVWPSE